MRTRFLDRTTASQDYAIYNLKRTLGTAVDREKKRKQKGWRDFQERRLSIVFETSRK